MSKKDKLETLDKLVLDKMIAIMNSDDEGAMASLSDLSVPMNYLKNNATVAEKAKSSVEKDTAKRLAEAEERRKNKGL